MHSDNRTRRRREAYVREAPNGKRRLCGSDLARAAAGYDALLEQVANECRRQAVYMFCTTRARDLSSWSGLSRHKMPAVFALSTARRSLVTHRKREVWNVRPDVRRFAIREPEFAVARRV